MIVIHVHTAPSAATTTTTNPISTYRRQRGGAPYRCGREWLCTVTGSCSHGRDFYHSPHGNRRDRPRRAPPDARARASRRRVEQGRGVDGPLRRRGRRRARGDLHRRRARLDPQPQDGPPGDPREHPRDPAPGDGAGARHPRRHPGLARLRRLRVAGGRPEAAAAGRLLRAADARGRQRAADPADQELPAAGHDDVRRERRLSAPRPHHVPPGLGLRVREGRGSVVRPRAGRGLAGQQALLPPRLQPPEDARRSTRRCSSTGWSRRTPSGSRSGSSTPSGTSGSRPGCRAATTSACATRRCWRTRPRSTPTASGSRSRGSSRQTVWPTEDYELVTSHVESELPEDDLFAGIEVSVGQ